MNHHHLAILLAGTLTQAAAAPPELDASNVVWTTPGTHAADSMPLGNGELGINLWVEANGDLLFYLSRNDSFSEISQLCKVGKVRVSLSPNPFATGSPFRQELKLRDGVCEIVAGNPAAQVKLKVFVDTAQPVVHVTGDAAQPVTVTAKIESWRTEKQKVPGGGTVWTLQGGPGELLQAADVFPPAKPDSISWYHRNDESPAFESTVKVQSLEPIRQSMHDPLLHRTFGGWVTGQGFKATDARTLTASAPTKSFALRVASPSAQTPTADAWLALAATAAAKSADATAALARTTAQWHAFWDRSWVICEAGPGKDLPMNNQPLRVGFDSGGGSRFPGLIGKATVTGSPLAPADIAAHAAAAPDIKADPKPAVPDLSKGLTLEAWVKPESASAGRILDSITVGGADGFLLDNHPGDSLRLIVGNSTLQAPAGILKPGTWQHVAGTFDPKSGAAVLFLNGREVARHGGPGATAANMTVGKAHTLQRYMQACAGRGLYPIKFNGSIFTVEPTRMGQGDNPDWRRWGDCHWWQNVRMPYHAMQAAGDFDLMLPLFNMFEAIRPFAEARAKLYHNVEGGYFAETMTVWGTYSNGDYGWNRTGLQPKDVQSPYWRFAWNQGLELVALMLDYYDYTGDDAFAKARLLPMATSVLKYFDTRFAKDARGKIIVDPTQSVETYWHGVTNDTPVVAGLNDLSRRLCGLPETATSPEQRAFFSRMKAAAPPVPIEDAVLGGRKIRRIAVAEKYDPQRSNCENPELFPIWPFRLFGIDRPLLEEARHAYQLRGSHNDVGWGYDSNAAALLGLTAEAARILKVKIANSHAAYRWPATWGPNFDWLPDQCHGGNLMATTHLMLLQHRDDKILLLPAWPPDWDVSFKLHAPKQTTVEATVRGGKVVSLKVEPEARRKDVVLAPGFQLP
jgi:hypothetical protein